MEDFWLKSAFLATFPSNSIGLKLTQKIRVLGILMQIIKCPILVVTMKLLIAPRIHILVVLWTFTFPPSFLITLYIASIQSTQVSILWVLNTNIRIHIVSLSQNIVYRIGRKSLIRKRRALKINLLYFLYIRFIGKQLKSSSQRMK